SVRSVIVVHDFGDEVLRAVRHTGDPAGDPAASSSVGSDEVYVWGGDPNPPPGDDPSDPSDPWETGYPGTGGFVPGGPIWSYYGGGYTGIADGAPYTGYSPGGDPYDVGEASTWPLTVGADILFTPAGIYGGLAGKFLEGGVMAGAVGVDVYEFF